MKSRSVAASFFVVFCLLLCGLILRRQIAAHPLPPETRHQFASDQRFSGGQQGFWSDFKDWHPAAPSVAKQAHETIQGQLAALRAGDGRKALFYQSHLMRERFAGPDQFMEMIANQYPEFGHSAAVRFGPIIWTDKTESRARVLVKVEGENGQHDQEIFLLVREGGQFKVNSVWPPWRSN